MLRPAMSQILKPGESYYEFVVAVARKAREIASDAEENKYPLEEKPVTMAVQMFASGEEKLSNMEISMEKRIEE
ncbi:MAG: DNA-directed RNA polymerase subunit omega [Angelakisella sp.]|nr:DNA-directed RNA polymerase subunit omega [Angelakisella sp.]